MTSLCYNRTRRGGTLALVLCLMLSLAAIMLGSVTLAAVAGSAAERDYRRSQALALAEAAVAEARTGGKPHGPRPLGPGRYAWAVRSASEGKLIVARGEVEAANGSLITRTVRARVVGSRVEGWEEGP